LAPSGALRRAKVKLASQPPLKVEGGRAHPGL